MKFSDRVMNRVNRLTEGLGVQLFDVPGMQGAQGDMRDVFEEICKTNSWGSAESVSGEGSTRTRTAEYLEGLAPTLRAFGVGSFFDAPCGDLNWIGSLLKAAPMTYKGGDISPSVIEIARRKEPHLDVGVFDICHDAFPDMDVWHCRDCLFHLPLDAGLQALRNFSRSRMRYALLTCNRGLWLNNFDISAGGFRPLDLRRSPFNLPAPKAWVKDFPWFQEFPRYVGLWTRDQIAAAVG